MPKLEAQSPVTREPACCVCKGPLGFGSGLIELGKKACDPCRTKSLAIRKQRWDSSKAGTNAIYARLRSELRQLSAETNAARDELSAMEAARESKVESFRNEAIASLEDRIRRMTFWQRLRILFNPFGVKI